MAASDQSKAVLLIPYFGRFPPWFELFLLSCGRNPSFRFMFYTDQPTDHFPRYANVEWRSDTLDEVRKRIAALTGLDIPKLESAYRLCDYRPAYGELFAADIKEPFWGHCDIDVIWGRLDVFLTSQVFENDIISGHPTGICGAFTLYRNSQKINSLYRHAPELREVFTGTSHSSFDEGGFSRFVQAAAARGELRFANGAHGHSESRATFAYVDGKVMRDWSLKEVARALRWKGSRRERMFFHFRTWKAGMKYDFDPSMVRGWKLRPENLSAIV